MLIQMPGDLFVEASMTNDRTLAFEAAVPIGRRPRTDESASVAYTRATRVRRLQWRACLPAEVVDGGSKADDSGDSRRACLEFLRNPLIRRFFERYILDHIPAALLGRHLFQQAALPYSTPIPVGPKILWPENVKKSQSMRLTSIGMWGVDCAPSTKTGTPCAWAIAIICSTGLTVPKALETCVTATNLVRGPRRAANCSRINSPASLIGATRTCARLLCQHLPGYDVRVMFHRSQEDFISSADMSAPIGLRHQIDGFGGPADKDDFLRVRGADELPHFFSPAFVQIGRVFARRGRPGGCSSCPGCKIRGGVDYALWFLRRGGVVEPDERIPVDMLLSGGKVPPMDRFQDR